MPRDITGASPGTIAAAIALPVTEPGYLVYLGFDQALRHSTRKSLSWGGYAWTGGLGTRVASVTDLAASLELRNSDLSASALVLGNRLADIPCEIYALYDGDAVLLFSGYLDAARVGERVTLTARAMSLARKVPNRYITYPTFNHLVAPGTQIRWGLDTITLEASG